MHVSQLTTTAGSYLDRSADCWLTRWLCSAQGLTTGPDVARHFAEALTLLYRREGNAVDSASLVGLDQSAVEHLEEVRAPILIPAVMLSGRPSSQAGFFAFIMLLAQNADHTT